jgi:YD repeat-containing protein
MDRQPARVLAGGKEAKFTYDPQTQLVEIAMYGTRQIEVQY